MVIAEGVRSYWAEQKPADILAGLSIDNSIFLKYLPIEWDSDPERTVPFQKTVIDLGAGNGKLERQLKNLNRWAYGITALDINELAMNNLSEEDIRSGVGDVTKWSEGLGTESILKVESFDAVVAQAVTPSLLDDNENEWKAMFDAMDMWLKPGGFFIFNDFRAADMYYAPLAKQIGGEAAQKIMESWSRRYENNQKAFIKLRLPKRTFAVGKVGTEGKMLENGSVKDLLRLYENKEIFERFARHIDPVEVDHKLRGLMNYQLREQSFSYYLSRGQHGLLAPVALQVWQKPEIYRYEHNQYGLNINRLDITSIALQRFEDLKAEAQRSEYDNYFVLALARIIRHAPDSQILPLYRLMKEFRKWRK